MSAFLFRSCFLGLSLWLVFIWTAPAPAQASSLLDGLTPAQIDSINRGRLLYIGHEVGKPWPKAVVYRFVEATPREVMAVFTNYAAAPQFVPNVLRAQIQREVHPWEQEVFYELSVPLLPNETYVATNILSFRDHGKQLEVSWKANKATYFQSSVGNLRVEAYHGGTLLRYTNLVDPGSRFAIMLRPSAENQIKATVQAIAKRVEFMRKRHPQELAREVERLNQVLAQLPASQKQ